MPFDMSVLQLPMLPLDLSVVQQPVSSLDVSVLKLFLFNPVGESKIAVEQTHRLLQGHNRLL
jgi:hypothetical protein